MKILAIDPSVNNVGIAQYDTAIQELTTSLFHPRRDRGESRVNIANQIVRHLHFNNFRDPEKLIIEYPNFQDSERGQIAAQKGYTLDLAYIAGHIIGSFRLHSGFIETPTPIQWKGNLPKDAVGARFERRFGVLQNTVSDHEFEAAMMIAWYLDKQKPG